MTYVMEMSTDQDIVYTSLNKAWNPIVARYDWNEVAKTSLGIPNQAVIVVVAHGNNTEIGNAKPGAIDINAQVFLALVQGNMANNAMPGNVFISTCSKGIAEFAAGVRIAAEQNDIWCNTRIFGHSDPVDGPVPPPNDIRWYEIY